MKSSFEGIFFYFWFFTIDPGNIDYLIPDETTTKH